MKEMASPAVENELLGDSNQVLADSLFQPLLATSWQRSMGHGLRRQDKVLFTNPVSKSVERRTVEENHLLLSHATPEMVKLYGGLGSARWLALCVNSRGQIICTIGDQLSAPNELRALMHPGRSLLESELGTTAPGCVLAIGQSIVVCRGEHYLQELASFFCASAPIFGPNGSVAGAIDISGIDVEALPIANDMVDLAARAIENSMLRDVDDCAVLHFHADDRLLGTPFEALLAVRLDGSVAGANRTARRLMSPSNLGATPLHLESLFATSIDVQSMCSQSSEPIKVRSHAGALAYVRVERRLSQLVRSPCAPVHRPPPPAVSRKFVLRDEALARTLEKANRALAHGLPVILEGETGTGKEVFARALHEAVRPTGPFIALNCAAIPEGLIEAELFGYADGAFTGARRGGAKGKVELAHGGILFLDEIGDMPLAMQSRLLRVIQERAVMRIGGNREVTVDTLIISATHQCLQELVAGRAFREDLFYRLNGFTLALPPLRERKDIADIAEVLLRQANGLHGSGRAEDVPLSKLITPLAMARLLAYPWPGNIRQLQQTIYSLSALRSTDTPIELSDLPDDVRCANGQADIRECEPQKGPGTLKEAERHLIQQALRDHGDNISAAARALDISRTTLYKKIKRFGKIKSH